MSSAIPQSIVDAFLELCAGDFSYRLPRTMARDADDTGAFFFNSIAEELERIVRESKEQETRLALTAQKLAEGLTRVAAGDFTVQIERDHREDDIDVLVFLVNSTIAEIAHLTQDNQRLADEARQRLEALVAERTLQLRESEENFRHLFDAAPVPQLLLEVDAGRIVDCNERARQVLDLSSATMTGIPARTIFDNGDDLSHLLERLSASEMVDAKAIRLRGRNAEPFWTLMNARVLVVRGKRVAVLGFTDLTEQKGIEARLFELATRDELTRVLNRRSLFEHLREEVARSERYDRPLCLAMIDLDHFKSINDRLGHALGDEALRLVAATLREQLRTQDILGRYGGEEFAIALVETSAPTSATVLERLRSAVSSLAMIHCGQRVPLAVSIGATHRVRGDTLDQLFERADSALYAAKAAGRDRVAVREASADRLGSVSPSLPIKGW